MQELHWVVLQKLSQETCDDAQRRFSSKLAITRRLYQWGYEREDVVNLFEFIDWVMSLQAGVITTKIIQTCPERSTLATVQLRSLKLIMHIAEDK